MIDRTEERFGLKPERLAGDTAYGSAPTLNWLVNEKGIAPHIPVIDKSKREDGTFSLEDFTFYKEGNVYICPAFKTLTTTGKIMNDDMLFYRAKHARLRGMPLQAAMLSEGAVAQDLAQHLRGGARCGASTGQDRGLRAIVPRAQTRRDAVCSPKAHPPT
jgi:hypothetical protein